MEHSDKSKDRKWAWFLFSFKGRINRKLFWMFNLIVFTGGLLLGAFTEISPDINNLTKPQLMFMIWIFWPSLAVQAKRWHDRNKSALWIFLNLTTVLGPIGVIGPIWALIENGFLPGTPSKNRFGPDPLKNPVEG